MGWRQVREREPIGRRRGGTGDGAEVLLRYLAAALAPALVILPVRALAVPDSSPFTVLLLGPALEESLKLSATLLALTVAALVLPRGRDPENALRYWLALAPWIVGGAFGLTEGLVVYPGNPGTEFSLRELAHAAFAALGLAGVLGTWRVTGAPYVGIGVGLGAAWLAHFFFNVLAVDALNLNATFLDQALYGLAVAVVAAACLGRTVAREPASPEARVFLEVRDRGP